VDLLPDVPREVLRERLVELAGRPGAPGVLRIFGEQVPRRVLAAAARQAGLGEENPSAGSLSRAHRHELIEALKGLDVPVHGTLGWEQAEVTAGGLALSEVSPMTLEVTRCPG